MNGAYTTLHSTFTGTVNTIGAGLLSPGGYTCCITARVETETAQDCVTFEVIYNSPPRITRMPENIELHNPNDVLLVQGRICYNGRLSIMWESLVEGG